MPPNFELLGAHPVLDFVNTLDDRYAVSGATERLAGYGDLLAFLEQTSLLDGPQIAALRKHARSPAAAKVLRRAHELREVLASVFYGLLEQGKPPAEWLKPLELYLIEAQQHRELAWVQDSPEASGSFRTDWVWGGFGTDAELPLWAIAQSAGDLLASGALARVRECASPTCRWLFLDTSKNHSRRWCDMRICGNRMKARRFQARRH